MTTKVTIDKIGKKPIDIDALSDVQLAVIIRVAVQQLDPKGEYHWDRELTIGLVVEDDPDQEGEE